ncbi:unnamed protein product, partial [Prorocentrum cordatum]
PGAAGGGADAWPGARRRRGARARAAAGARRELRVPGQAPRRQATSRSCGRQGLGRERPQEGRQEGEGRTAGRRTAGARIALRRQRPRRTRGRGRGAAAAAKAPEERSSPVLSRAGADKKSWRQERPEGGGDQRDLSTDEEARDKKLEEARKRREAIMKAKMASDKGGEAPGPGVVGGEKPADSGSARAGRETAGAEDEAKGAEEKKEGMGDMFDERAEAADELKKAMRQSAAIGLTGASGEDWDDAEGYYIPKIGEVMGDRFLVVETSGGRGVFSNVVKAKDQQAEGDQAGAFVAVKILRANAMMTKAAEQEVSILERLNAADKKDKRHIIRLLSTFAYRKHFCLVFEGMQDDLRGALKKYTKNKGMHLPAVRAYTQQLIVGLGHMHKMKIIHADIKPDNILIAKGHQVVKYCDLGTAIEFKDINVTPYLASRFYRAPEVILGCVYDEQVDTWALACTLFEIFTGKTLLQSKTNNDHLRKIMELKGKIPGKVIKKGAVWKNHFSDELDFKHLVDDPASGQQVVKVVTDLNATRSLKDLVLERVGKEKQQSEAPEDQAYCKRAVQFADLLEKMTDPANRIRPDDALQHSFLQDTPAERRAKEDAARQAARERQDAARSGRRPRARPAAGLCAAHRGARAAAARAAVRPAAGRPLWAARCGARGADLAVSVKSQLGKDRRLPESHLAEHFDDDLPQDLFLGCAKWVLLPLVDGGLRAPPSCPVQSPPEVEPRLADPRF